MVHINFTELLPDRPGIPPMAPLPDAEEINVSALLASFEKGRNGEEDGIDLICILGPTASGKTRYAVDLCHRLNALRRDSDEKKDYAGAEILSGDSRQVYRGMDIGTGKDLEEYGTIPYHLIDIAAPGDRYSIYDYQRDFGAAYDDIIQRGGIPVLCGGSGLYVQAATCGYALVNVPPDPELRERLEKENPLELRRRLIELRPDTSEGTLQSTRRVIRALEIAEYEKDHPVKRSLSLPKRTYYIGILAGREERVERIDRRLDERLKGGLIEEVKRLLDSGVAPEDLIYYGLEYKFVTQHVLGILEYDQMRILLANAIHQFAKRQMTWLRGMEREGICIHWTRP